MTVPLVLPFPCKTSRISKDCKDSKVVWDLFHANLSPHVSSRMTLTQIAIAFYPLRPVRTILFQPWMRCRDGQERDDDSIFISHSACVGRDDSILFVCVDVVDQE